MFTKLEFKPEYVKQELNSLTIYNLANQKYCKILPLALLDITENTVVSIDLSVDYILNYLYQPGDIFVYEPILIPIKDILFEKRIPSGSGFLQYFPVNKLITDTETFGLFFSDTGVYPTQSPNIYSLEIKHLNMSGIIKPELNADVVSFTLMGKYLVPTNDIYPISNQRFTISDLFDSTSVSFDYTETLYLSISSINQIAIVNDPEHEDNKKFNDLLKDKFGKGIYWLLLSNSKLNYQTPIKVWIDDKILFPKLFVDSLMLDSLFDIQIYKSLETKTIQVNVNDIDDSMIDKSKVLLVAVRYIRKEV